MIIFCEAEGGMRDAQEARGFGGGYKRQLVSCGLLGVKMRYLFDFFIFSDEQDMSPEEFYICIDKSLRALCNLGEIQLPYIEKQQLEAFKDLACPD